ncbi:carbon-monoxide dehydrogenase small subunit [Paenibacillus sp. UNC496MF]|uniref:(2Fe-2S)-binding protein n=1 Tax=Paenibacillus sp. UNC496MF TaxID=1502753 RepID=UPI0008E659AC|nr:(2Fe-2S)-binding protein [Paenibacillus sp. UNC496MF]SFI33179.1 carbon-monoxide dehydrogenase small subunit [Paenibacillus sp. UNC496MF]
MKKPGDLRQPVPSEQFRCTVNGAGVSLEVTADKRLLAILRDDLALTGTKRSCEIGRCGACMVLLDGKPVNACLTMAYQCDGRAVTTIEGLSGAKAGVSGASAELHPVQRAFLEEGGYQCGYCTPGMIVAVTALLRDNPRPDEDEIEEALSGNLCRCTGYGGIVRSVKRAIDQWREDA